MADEKVKTEITNNKVPVFLGWSGKASNDTAKVLHKYLPSIINALDPFISDEDIEKGTVWRAKIAKELEKSECGILCLTPENVNSLWIHFEAGALSKRFVESRACTFLMGLTPSEFDGPLTDFQSTSFDKEDFFKLVKTLNSACGNLGQIEERLKISFDALWPQIEKELTSIEQGMKKSKPTKSSSSKKQDDTSIPIRHELLEELVVRLRSQDQRFSKMQNEINTSQKKSDKAVQDLDESKKEFLEAVNHYCDSQDISILQSLVYVSGNILFITEKHLSFKQFESLKIVIQAIASAMGFSSPKVKHKGKEIYIVFT